MAIHDITDKINLSNGESLIYTLRKKKQIIEQFHSKQKRIIGSFSHAGIPVTEEEYRSHYSSFENLPFAFTDIEMVFDENRQAVDWIFRYGNPALSKLEKLPDKNVWALQLNIYHKMPHAGACFVCFVHYLQTAKA